MSHHVPNGLVRRWNKFKQASDCLKCGREFEALSKYNRLCPLCQAENRKLGRTK